ncbi:MAG TPA: hypothetical protein VJ960_01555 [Oceanipulchritudo sp.]|nr:hypothetical protein [Oceanipulchritudo sp.]
MENRRPRKSRFGTESKEARLAYLREQAPTLRSSRRMRVYAIFGSVLLVLTVGAFYLAMQIYRVASEDRVDAALIEVDKAPEVPEREIEKALKRAEREEAAAEAAYAEELEALKAVDLLEKLPEG